MNLSRSALNSASQPSAEGGLIRSWVSFWFTPVDPVGLHVVRLLAGLLFLLWLLPFAGQLDSLFGLNGWFDGQAYKDSAALMEQQRRPETARENQPVIPLTWSMLYLWGDKPQALAAFYWGSVAVIVLFTLGVCTRPTAILTWLIVASFTANPAIDYDADAILLVLAFYLMVGYVLLGQRDPPSWLALLLGPRSTLLLGRPSRRAPNGLEPSLGANIAVRLLQVHFAIIMVATGLHKLQYGGWWAGLSLWYPLYPPFTTTLAEAREHLESREAFLSMLSIGAYAVLAWQICFPLFAWRQRWRPLLLGGAGVGWLGLTFMFRLPLLGPILVVGCLSYVTAEEWHRFFAWLADKPGVRILHSWLPVAPAQPLEFRNTKKDEAESLVALGDR